MLDSQQRSPGDGKQKSDLPNGDTDEDYHKGENNFCTSSYFSTTRAPLEANHSILHTVKTNHSFEQTEKTLVEEPVGSRTTHVLESLRQTTSSPPFIDAEKPNAGNGDVDEEVTVVSKGNRSSIEDITDVIMPTGPPDQRRLKLFEAPPSFKSKPVRLPPLATETDMYKLFPKRPGPMVIERRFMVNGRFKRSGTLPARSRRRIDVEVASVNSESPIIHRPRDYDPETIRVPSSASYQSDMSRSYPAEYYQSFRRTRPVRSNPIKAYPYTEPDHVISVSTSKHVPETNGSSYNRRQTERLCSAVTVERDYSHHNSRSDQFPQTVRITRSTPATPVPHTAPPDARSMVYTTTHENSHTSLPPVPQRQSISPSTRRDRQTGELLSPIGPPVEQVFTRIDPATGKPVRVTSRSQSFADLEQNVVLMETNETIEGEKATEHRVKQHTVRKYSSPSMNRPPSALERNVENVQPVQQNRVYQTRNRESTSFDRTREYRASSIASPYRTSSQVNVNGQDGMARQQWASDMNIRTTSTYRQAPMHSTYSAHRENMQRKEEQKRLVDENASTRYFEEGKTSSGGGMFEEVETITLQPIGRGVHDLEPAGSVARSYRTNTPTVIRATTPGFDMSDGYRTLGTANRDATGQYGQYSGTSEFGTGNRTTEHRYRSTHLTEQHYRAQTVPPNYAGSVGAGSAFGDTVDMDRTLMRQVQDTLNEWYLPEKTREEVTQMLKDSEPGSFIIRNSLSCRNGFSLGMKAPPYATQASTSPDFIKSGMVKHFLIRNVPMVDGRGEGFQLDGFNGQPIFPSLAAFVAHHCVHPGPLPCVLRLPTTTSASLLANHRDGIRYGHPLAGGGIMADMVYLGCVPVDRLENAAAVRMAVTHILGQSATHPNGLPKRCDVLLSANAQDGIRFNDVTRRVVSEYIKPSKIIYCGMDPENRTYIDNKLKSRGMTHSRTFGIVIRKKQLVLRENFVHVFAEQDPKQSAFTMVNYLKQTFPGHRAG